MSIGSIKVGPRRRSSTRVTRGIPWTAATCSTASLALRSLVVLGGQRVSVVAERYVLLVNAACAASLGAGLLLIAILGVLSPGTEITVQPTEPPQHSVRGHQ